MHFYVVDFGKDILDSALDMVSERCIMVFPTRVAADLARKRFEPRWNLEEILWLTMEDFKRAILARDKPMVEDEKRLLCLWQVLTSDDKAYFHLREYNDVVEWGTNLFDFLMEFREAGRSPDELIQLSNDPMLYIRAWQDEHLSRIYAIYLRYKDFVEDLGMSDPIFRSSADELYISWQNYRLLLVNQFYFSKLEQEIIRSCEDIGNEVIILNHEVILKPDNWQMPLFEPENSPALNGLAERLKIYECDSEEQAALAFLALNEPCPDAAIIDSQFHQKPYSMLFSEDMVDIRQNLPISQTRLYRFQILLAELAETQEQTPGFIPLRILTRFCLETEIPSILVLDWDALQQEELRREIFRLAAEDVIMLDIHPEEQFPSTNDSPTAYPLLCDLCKRLFPIVLRIVHIGGIEELSALLGAELEPRKLCSSEELEKTDVLEQFWTSMANFSAIESLGVVRNWADVFSFPGIGIYRLWLDFLKPVVLRCTMPDRASSPWEITNLLDSRNRKFQNLTFLQVVEGILPQAPGSVWLLNESQRARLGLLSYDTIRSWERYYFFRLVLCSGNVQIFTYRNQEQNQKPSSFIGELLQLVPSSVLKVVLPVENLFKVYVAGRDRVLSEAEIFADKADISFCTLPAVPSQDFGQSREIKFSSYDISLLSRNPFAWYIQSLRKISELRTDLAESLSPALFGTLMHEWFAEILGNSSAHYTGPEALKATFTDDAHLRLALQSITHSRAFFYKIPKNYNEEFLNSIICDCLVASLKEFYTRFLEPYLAGTPFELIPEGARPDDERNYKLLATAEYAGQEYLMKIRGRADLRINTPGKRYIVDFKTGSAHAEQLIFYEWFYELIKNPEQADKMESHFWMILDRKINHEKKVRVDKRVSFSQDMKDVLLACFAEGYTIGRRSSDRHILKSITRSDLLLLKDTK